MNSRTIKVLGGVIIGIIAVLGVFLIVVPLIVSVTNSPDVAAAKEQNVRLQQQLQQLNGLQEQSSKLNTIRAQLVRQFPNTANVPDLINLISLAASNSGIAPTNIISFNFAAPVLGTAAPAASGAAPAASSGTTATPAPGSTTGTSQSQYASLGVSLSVKGSSDQFAKFMQSLTSLRRVFTITNFGISGEGNNATLTITGTTYIYRDIAVPGTSSSATSSASTTTVPQ